MGGGGGTAQPGPKQAADYFHTVFGFVDNALGRGESVLVHCLAGAHRAGTVGTACVMHLHNLPLPEALAHAKSCRSVINPIGDLPGALELLERHRQLKDAAAHKGGGGGDGSPSSKGSSSGRQAVRPAIHGRSGAQRQYQ